MQRSNRMILRKASVLLPRSRFLHVSILSLCSAALTKVSSAETPSRVSRVKGAFFGALVADALCLGSHYEYDAKAIKEAYGGKPIEKYLGPGEQMGGTTHGVGWGRRNYHPGQKKGDNTDYGLYNEIMLEYLSQTHKQKNQSVDLKNLLPWWQQKFAPGTWGAWIDTQTKAALQQVQSTDISTLAQNKDAMLGGVSNAMAFRGAPLPAAYDDEDAAAKAARDLMFTHRNREALDGGEFFARMMHRIVYLGESPEVAMEAVEKKMKNPFISAQVKKAVDKYNEVMDPSRPLGKEEFVDDLAMTSMARLWDVGKTEPIKVGKASPTEGTMPSSLYIILKYKDSFTQAARANAMVGGDNASRSVVIGAVLGAWHGVEGIWKEEKGGEGHLKEGLNSWDKCEGYLSKMPMVQEEEKGKGHEEL
uniref:ADP-ribosylhydrolase ARH3 n=1 Tax=Chromera velia CCMP2878 TaxID=1169474 RepID=A0A0G4FFI3_9ALVE|eukprot:Cvel_3291.t1-p1 / transcript=Cvel_3291.t1 / gene=Cvel_3291 / organism=Chromera_velia_CCMP2878 / gene_product=hypothetical protein / transcript_product=hypothetical protein / location=Cvel_scaffold129:117977-120257(-) / protein_length=418 / sequence_SO=supercontig / SO=protein_coding / is_pseudo=false